MQLQTVGGVSEGHEGEIYSCAYSPDGSLVLSAGWDGYLRIWDPASGAPMYAFQASQKPLSCCAISPDGQRYLSGSMEGVLAFWEVETQQLLQTVVAHTRPISTIRFAPDGQHFVTSSWDRKIVLRKLGKEGEGQTLAGHTDIVTGCEYSSDGKSLLSWSHDGTLRLWPLDAIGEASVFVGHDDRVTGAALSPDGAWAISAGRDGMVKLWDLANEVEVNSVALADEVRGVLFLLDGSTIVLVTAGGGMLMLTVPSFEVLFEAALNLGVMSCDLAPSGQQIALGGEDGQIHLLAVEGVPDVPLLITATLMQKRTANMLDRLFGKTKLRNVYHFTCPTCRHETELPALPNSVYACPVCRQALRFNSRVRELQMK